MNPGSTRRALLTGGSGFLGSHLVRRLRARGWEIHLLQRSPSHDAGSHLYDGSSASVLAAMQAARPEVVFHLASLFLASHAPEQIEELVDSNLLLGTQLLEAMSLCGVSSLVNTGTSWQYFHNRSYSPVNLYAATKQAFESILAYYVEARGFSAITLSLFDTYGPGDPRKKLLPLLLSCLHTGEPLLMSPGEQMLDLVHVDDVCAAYERAAEVVSVMDRGSAVYAVGGSERRSLREVVETLERVAGKSLNVHFGARPYREREVMQLWDGPTLPGWQPLIPLEKGFRALLET
jgi:nucleoside-diphosphate-sugar epimerase